MESRGKAGLIWSSCGLLILVILLGAGAVKLSGCSGSTPAVKLTGPKHKNVRDPKSRDPKNRDAKNRDATKVTGDSINSTIPDLFPADEVDPKEPVPIPDAPAEILFEPTVVLSESHRQTCLFTVGDDMPPMTLPNQQGEDQVLSKLYGEKLTVVVFWDIAHVYAEEQFLRLERETTSRFSEFGVSVVAINVGDKPAEVQSLAEQAENRCTCLLDQDGTAFGAVATGKLPRTYVLDAEGKVLWFDIEYSRSTERELKNAIYYFLRRGQEG